MKDVKKGISMDNEKVISWTHSNGQFLITQDEDGDFMISFCSESGNDDYRFFVDDCEFQNHENKIS